MEQKARQEPSVSQEYQITWVPTLQHLMSELGSKTPHFKVEVKDPKNHLERKWYVVIYPSESSRDKDKLFFKGYCWDKDVRRLIRCGWVTLDAGALHKGEIQFEPQS